MDPNSANTSPNQQTVPTVSTPVAPPTPTIPADAPLPQTSSPATNQPALAAPSPVSDPPKKSKLMLWVIILLFLAFVCGLFVVGWYFQSQFQKIAPDKETAITPEVKLTKLVIGTDATFQPMEYVASGEAKIIGYDIDLGDAIANEIGAKVEYKNITWDDLFKALDNKEIDMIISSVTITEERKEKYDFSDNYLNAGQVILTSEENTTITKAEDLQGKRIAVQEGTTNEQEALKYTLPNLVISYRNFEQAAKALVDGRVDAILSDLPGAKGIVTANPTIKIASDPITNEYYGIVFRKNDPNIAKINNALSSLITRGVLTDLKQKWLD